MRFLFLFLLVAGCGVATNLATSALTGGGGPSVEAQVGQNNTKQIVARQEVTRAGRDVNTSDISAQQVRDVVVRNDLPFWKEIFYWTLIIWMGWLDSPKRWPKMFMDLFRRRKRSA